MEIPAILYRQYLIGTFSVGGDGLGNLPVDQVLVRMTSHGIEAPDIDTGGNMRPADNFPVRTWTYGEVKGVQVFDSPHWAKWHNLPVPPLGTRIHFGESRSPLLLFTDQQDELLDGLENHGVDVDRHPIKLSPMLFGRK